MDPLALATAAVAVLSPYLVKAGEGAATKLGQEAVGAGGRLFGWLRSKFDDHGKETLDDLAKAPGDADNQAALRKQIRKVLTTDPSLAAELRAMLPAEVSNTDGMMQDVSGAGAKAAQVRGSGNTTNIG